ncbi:DUF1835 domain-containing protein [Noviherbaspirillum cavernae]|uniref:DUF1835 domain-containing protein n=1 Tax=Noviherbaspirillum cavernae TaxID=2320862 RepID=A0A418WYP7_9BURK|nr:DUF1835 domain-containing protein [Noviherbaspirillum cavernae]RJG05388.1 DUF1835 domain-containing protein [Noviherbaspirillum cavernae]
MIISLAQLRQQFSSAPLSSPEFQDGDPRKLQPLSLEQQKKRAKELLRGLRRTDPEAISRHRLHLPEVTLSADATPRLCDAQQIVARENGFCKWSELHAHCEYVRIAFKSVAEGSPSALDGDVRTLHIRCGHDIMHKLAVAGFTGDFLAFADPYVQGPVPHTDSLQEFIRIRARFLRPWFESPEAALERLTQDYAALEMATDYPRVMLWFEHDSYDQLILAKLFHFFQHAAQRPQQLRLICVSRFPGVKRFNGIGQLPAEAMRVLWNQFSNAGPAQLSLGKQAWDAITAPTPAPLRDLIATQTPAIPVMAKALARHLEELPSTRNGLSLTEHLTLKTLTEEGAMNASRLFTRYTNYHEPLPFLGDLQYWKILSGLADAERAAIVIDRKGSKPVEWMVSVTQLGRELLTGTADWLALNRIDRWVGGMHIDSRTSPVWRFDSK